MSTTRICGIHPRESRTAAQRECDAIIAQSAGVLGRADRARARALADAGNANEVRALIIHAAGKRLKWARPSG